MRPARFSDKSTPTSERLRKIAPEQLDETLGALVAFSDNPVIGAGLYDCIQNYRNSRLSPARAGLRPLLVECRSLQVL